MTQEKTRGDAAWDITGVLQRHEAKRLAGQQTREERIDQLALLKVEALNNIAAAIRELAKATNPQLPVDPFAIAKTLGIKIPDLEEEKK